MEKIHLSSILLTFLGSMRAFWKCPHLGPLAQDWKKWPLNEIFQSFWSVKYIVGFLLLRRNRSWQETLYFLNIGQGKALSMLIYRPYLIVWWYKLILSLPHRKGNRTYDKVISIKLQKCLRCWKYWYQGLF